MGLLSPSETSEMEFQGWLCKQQVKPTAQEGAAVVSKTGLFSLESPLSMSASRQTKSDPGDSFCPVSLSHYGKGWNVWVGL